ncbi:reverse transcriptase domain-containing protein, partial [Tanacetum coccineum]
MQEGMFLGYKVNTDGLKVCPDKADAVLSLPSSRCLKDVQKLNGKLASKEAEAAFKQMKKLIAELPMLTAPKEKEELIVYFAATKEAISAVLMTDRGGKQVLVYFVSHALRGPEINYTPMEKLVPRNAIKGQILADFIVERPEEESPDEIMTEPEELPEPWTLFTDGSFEATNNEAEYEALIAGLRITGQMGIKNLQAHVDSRLVANQVNGSYVAKESGMIQYLSKVKTLAKSFREFSIKQVPRSENKKADALSKIASTSFAHLSKQVLVEELKEKSMNKKEILTIVEEEGSTWMTPICEYLTNEILLADKKKARAVRHKAA